MPEIITDGHDGYLVETIDQAVEAVGRLTALRRHSCRQTVERRFTSDVMAAGYMETYRAILESSSPATDPL
jgi:glycosyltransferase involved in cell wall biosynthesis